MSTLVQPTPPGVLHGLRHQFRYDWLAQLRNPASVFFSLGLPVVFLLAFASLGDGGVDSRAYYTASTMIIGIFSSTLTNLAITLTYLREYGILKRVLITPLPRVSYLGSRVAAAGALALASTAILGLIGWLVFGVTPHQPLAVAGAVLTGLVVGNALGVALAAVMPNENASSPVANAVVLPLLMGSGAFFPLEQWPAWVGRLCEFLPATPIVSLATAGYAGTAGAREWATLLAVGLVWTAAALLVVRWRFSWAPRKRR